METDLATNAISEGLKLSIGFQIHLKKLKYYHEKYIHHYCFTKYFKVFVKML
jgi:hypothetical protein